MTQTRAKDLAFVLHFHSARLVIIRLETASVAVYSLVALETAWPVEALLKAIEDFCNSVFVLLGPHTGHRAKEM